MTQLLKYITGPKIARQLKQNEAYIKALNEYKLANTLETEKARRIFESYTALQAVLQKRLPQNMVPAFIPYPTIIPHPDTEKCCNICNFPITSLLTNHHIIPKSKGGKKGPTVKLCATCHVMLHKCANSGTIDQAIYDYYAAIDGAIEKIETYIKSIKEA